MKTSSTFNRFPRTDRPALLVLCLAISIFMHLSIVVLLPLVLQSSSNRVLKQKPTFVRLVDKPKPKPVENKKAEYELDQHPPKKEQQIPVQAKRLAESPQRVEKEQAPKGEDAKDQRAIQKIPAPVKPMVPTTQPTAPGEQTDKTTISPQKRGGYDSNHENHPEKELDLAKEQINHPSLPAKEFPTLEQLTQLPQNTLDRLASSGRATSEKNKQRDDVAEGDEVWLNLEQGLLISFFRRFRNQIEGVWNYPLKAKENGIEGVLLLKITVDREGNLLDVDLLNGSGSDLLDYEAIQAVYRAAPFGPLPKQYPHAELKINAYFKYLISNKYIYGR